jgi:hypothetical protein
MHLIDKHMYPKNFFFVISREGIDGRRSLLLEGQRRRRRRSSTGTSSRPSSSQGQGQSQELDVAEESSRPTESRAAEELPREADAQQQPDTVMEDLSGAMSALQFVPMSVRFGRGKKAGFSKR